MKLPRFSYSLRLLLALFTLVAVGLGGIAWYIDSNRREWLREQAAFDSGGSVMTPSGYYVPNLDCYQNPVLPESLLAWFPDEIQNYFWRVTVLDITTGTGLAEDFRCCLPFTRVETIRLGPVAEPREFLTVLQGFPNLKTLEVGYDDAYDKNDPGRRHYADLIHEYLPHVTVVRPGA